MKKLSALFLLLPILFFTNCTQEQAAETDISTDLILQTTITNLLPNSSFDNSHKGLYHGIIASGTNQSRGKIWLNIGNDNKYTAYVEMVSGNRIAFTLTKESLSLAPKIYKFKSDNSSFTVDLTNYLQPVFSNISLNGEPFLAYVVKGTNNRMPFSFTGTFTNNVANPTFSGTWNLISTGMQAPEGFGYETIQSAVVTFGGSMFTDTTMETFNYSCVGNPTFTPQMGTVSGNANAVIGHLQTSNFNGPTSWDLSTGNGSYFNNACGIITSGSFTWTNSSGDNPQNGFIFID